jgi:hypothetical protein
MEQLRRAVRRYELYRPRLPDGGRGTRWEDWPDRGIHALLHSGAQSAAGRLYAGPQLLFVAIERLDQASYRLRAAATAHDPARQERARRRAERRQTPSAPPAGGLGFRTLRTWPAWMLLEGASEPTFDANGRLLLDPELLELYAPAPQTDMWRRTVRDAYLLAHQAPPVELDSRRLMAARDRGDLLRRRSPQAVVDVELRELSHLTGMPITRLERLSVELRGDWLQDQRRQAAERQAQETEAFRASIAGIYPPSSI